MPVRLVRELLVIRSHRVHGLLDIALDDVLGHVERVRLADDGAERAVGDGVVSRSLDRHHNLLANVRRLLGVRERSLGHLELVVLELAPHAHSARARNGLRLQGGAHGPLQRHRDRLGAHAQ